MSKDISINNKGCSSCSISQLSVAKGCQLTSYDGLTTTYCSIVTDGNRPTVGNCYVGVFTTDPTANSALSAACSGQDFCQVK